MTLKAVAAAAGHGNVRVTQLIYWHLTEESRDEVSTTTEEEAEKLVGACPRAATLLTGSGQLGMFWPPRGRRDRVAGIEYLSRSFGDRSRDRASRSLEPDRRKP